MTASPQGVTNTVEESAEEVEDVEVVDTLDQSRGESEDEINQLINESYKVAMDSKDVVYRDDKVFD